MKILNLKRLRRERGMTLEELAQAVGTSKQTVQRYESGVITNVPTERIVALADALGTTPAHLMGWAEEPICEGAMPIQTKRLPVLGDIACGSPITATESYGDFVTASEGLDADFCLKARGDSMTGARIYDGDIVFIRSQDHVDNGEIAAVIIGDEATLKRVYYYADESKLILTPENPRYAPLVYVKDELSEVRIIGKAVAFQSTVL